MQVVDASKDLVEERLDHVLWHIHHLLVHLRRPVELDDVLFVEVLMWIVERIILSIGI